MHLDAAFGGALEFLLEPLADRVVLPDKRLENDPLLCLLYRMQHGSIQLFAAGIHLHL
jgi:hypothetical protein